MVFRFLFYNIKYPRNSLVFLQLQGKDFIARPGLRATECVTFFRLVGGKETGKCSRSLVLSLKLPSFTCVRALVLKNNSKLLSCIFPEKEPGPCPRAVLYYCFQTVPLLCFSTSPPFPDKQLCESALCEAEWSLFLTNEKWGTQEGFVPHGTPQAPAWFHYWFITKDINKGQPKGRHA